MSKEKPVTATFPVFSIIGVVFIVLKFAGVTEVASWSWLWVLSPFWIPLVIALGIVCVVFIGALIIEFFKP